MQHYGSTPLYMAPRGEYAAYYAKAQYGQGLMPAYGGASRQKGHGLGSLLSGLLRGAVPLLSSIGKRVAKSAGTAILSTGTDILQDVIAGKGVKASVKSRVSNNVKKLLKRGATATKGYINDIKGPTATKRRATSKGTRRAQQKGGKRKKRAPAKGANLLF